MAKDEWEEKFDQQFKPDSYLTDERFLKDNEYFVVDDSVIPFLKNFIRSLLADRDRELIEKLKGMEVGEAFSGHWKTGYNNAISDIIKYIKSEV